MPVTHSVERSERWWTTRTVVVAPTTVNGEPVLGMQVLKTRVFFNLTEARKIGADLAVVGTAYALTTSLPLAGALGLVRKLVDNLTLLDEDERELVRVIMGLVPGNPYAAGVPEERVRAAYAMRPSTSIAFWTAWSRRRSSARSESARYA